MVFITAFIREDDKYNAYQRTVYTVLDVIGNIGGLMEGIQSIGFLFVFLFTKKIFQAELMKRLYQQKKTIKLVKEKKRKNTKIKNNKDIEAHPNSGESPNKESTNQESNQKFS